MALVAGAWLGLAACSANADTTNQAVSAETENLSSETMPDIGADATSTTDNAATFDANLAALTESSVAGGALNGSNNAQ